MDWIRNWTKSRSVNFMGYKKCLAVEGLKMCLMSLIHLLKGSNCKRIETNRERQPCFKQTDDKKLYRLLQHQTGYIYLTPESNISWHEKLPFNGLFLQVTKRSKISWWIRICKWYCICHYAVNDAVCLYSFV